MKKLILILSLLPLFSFGQTYYSAIQVYQGNINSTYNVGDTIDIYFKPTQTSADSDSILIQYYSDNGLVVAGRADFKTSHTTSTYAISIGYTNHFKIIIPSELGLRYAKVGVGKTPNFTVSNPSGIINPFLPENKNKEFNFYSQNGSLIKKCKVSDLAPGFYISNGFKVLVNKEFN